MNRIFILLILFYINIVCTTVGFALSGNISGTWAQGNTIIIDGDVQILSGDELIIEPGVQVLFTGPYTFTVQGKLEAAGTPDNLIIFTRADSTDESKWKGIRFDNADDTSLLEYCRVEHIHREGMPYTAVRGGAVWIDNCSPTVRYCTLSNNYCRNENRNGTGAGICLNSDSNSVVEFNTIEHNISDSGAGVYIGNGCDAIIRYNKILNNSSYSSGAGLYLAAWGNATIYNNLIKDNSCFGWSGGGGITLWNGNCDTDNCTHVYNNIIDNNTSSNSGGGIYSRYNDSKIYNNTIVNNSATEGGGIYVLNQGNDIPYFFNSIIRNNNASAGAQVFLEPDTGSQVSITYSNIQSGYSGTGNIDADPLFKNPGSGVYSLNFSSPCIDAGDNESENLPEFDYAGKDRRYDDIETVDTGNGTAPIVDMGAYEYHPHLCPCDLDDDLDVDTDDLSLFVQEYGQQTVPAETPEDFDEDGDVDGMDLITFAQSFGNCQ